jgi:phosphoribosylaminoimidazolecarboxamide formyltransferase/IMP cyclohydrolase
MKELEESDCSISEETSKELAIEVFKKTSLYDGAISRYLSYPSGKSESGAADELPTALEIHLRKARSLRYGENPHQKAALYGCDGEEGKGIIDAEQIQGKELSFNNIIDIDSAFEMVASFEEPTVSIVKHNNPCGIASASTLKQAYLDALECDRQSAFGSIMGFNGKIDKKFAETILAEADFIECIIAPEYDLEALEAFKTKKNIRILKKSLPEYPPRTRDMKRVRGGFLVQDKDFVSISAGELKTVTKKKPSDAVMDSLLFAWKAVSFVKSNAIVLCRGTKSVGIGAGQMSRVDSVIIAVRKAGKRAKGAVLASDAFFPMADSIEEAHKAGVAAIIQPGGSIRDQEVIDACDKFGIPMVFTGKRHFRH